MQNLRIQDKIALIALALAILIASAVSIAVIGGTKKVSTITPQMAIGTAQNTQDIVVREKATRCRNKKTGRFIKCP